MKKLCIAIFLPLMFLTAAFFIFSGKTFHNIELVDNDEDEGNDMYNEAAQAQQLEFDKTKDPALGYVPTEKLFTAYEYAERSKKIAENNRTTTISSIGPWVERGPNADAVGPSNNNTRDGNGVASGRIKAIWVDLADATGNTVWIGGVGGGLWKTTNFKTSPATWIPINDFFTNLAIGTICQDPSNKNTMYFGTGERTYNTDAIRGGGIWKSTDHGVNWTLLANTTAYYNISKLLCDASGNLYVGSIQSNTGAGTNGFLRSTNGGTTFTNISPSSPAGISGRVSDFVISSTGRLHASFGYYNSTTPGYKYTDNPSTVTPGSWTSAITSYPVNRTANINCVLACKGNTLYALPSDSTSNVPAIYKSTDGGANWVATGSSPPNTGNDGFCSGQAWYCLAADVNPADANNVIIGSLNCYATTDGGTTWTQISDWVGGGTTGQYVHADQQIIKWNANNYVVVGSDGGIFYSADNGATFSDRNSGLRIKQFFSCDFHPQDANYFLAGAQDNGCHQFTSAGLNTTTEVTGGDGAFVHIDQVNPVNQICSYVFNRYRLSTDGGSTWTQYNLSNTAGKFINPTDYDNNHHQLYCGYTAGNYAMWDPLVSPASENIISIPAIGTALVSSVTVSPHVNRRVFFGTDITGGVSKVIKVDSAHNIPVVTDITGTLPTSLYVSCVAVGPNVSDNDLIVTYSSYDASLRHVFYSTNGGTTWTNISGNLPDMPVRWAVFDPTSNTKAWIATETGVWSTSNINGASTVWTASAGFPTVRTDMIKFRTSDQSLVVATHGRGLWTQTQSFVLSENNFVLQGKWKNEATTELTWNYSSSIITSFDIESSFNGKDFIKIGSAFSANTNYVDKPSFADIYYRIKSKNILGEVTYSNIVHLQKGTVNKDISSVKLFPNPVKDIMKIAFSIEGSGKINYQISGINGQVILKKDEDISATGDYIKEWNVQNLKPGTYLFTMIYNNKKITNKFLKQ